MVRGQVMGPEREVEGLERIWSQAALSPLQMKKQRPEGWRHLQAHRLCVAVRFSAVTCTQSPHVTATQLGCSLGPSAFLPP